MEKFSAVLALCAGNSPVPVNSAHRGQWRGALMFTLICARINDWVNNREAGDLRRLLDHYDVSVMALLWCITGSNVIIVGILLAFLTKVFAVHGALSFCQWVNMVAWDVRRSLWCHGIETFSALLALCAGNSPVTGEFPSQRPVTNN